MALCGYLPGVRVLLCLSAISLLMFPNLLKIRGPNNRDAELFSRC